MTEPLSPALSALDILLAELGPDDRLEAVIKYFCDAVNSGEIPDQRLLKELAEAMDNGKLVQKKRIGRPTGDGSGGSIDRRDFDLAYAVCDLRKKDVTRKAAIEQVMQDKNLTKDVVEKAYDAQRTLAETSWQQNKSLRGYIQQKAAMWDGILRNARRNAEILNDAATRALAKHTPKVPK